MEQQQQLENETLKLEAAERKKPQERQLHSEQKTLKLEVVERLKHDNENNKVNCSWRNNG